MANKKTQAHPEGLPPQTRLNMLVTLRQVLKVTKELGTLSVEDAGKLSRIGFSVVTGLMELKIAPTLEIATAMVGSERVTYEMLEQVVALNTHDYTIAPWGGPLGREEIYGDYSAYRRSQEAAAVGKVLMAMLAAVAFAVCGVLGFVPLLAVVLLLLAALCFVAAGAILNRKIRGK